MAFHEGWEEESESRDLRPVLKWGAIMIVGLITGLSCYLSLVPTGVLSELLLRESQAPESAVDLSEEDSNTPSATACPAEPPVPNQTILEFIADVNAGRYFSAWSTLDVTFQQSEYQLDSGAFQREWAPRGRIEMGQITYTLPSEEEAVLLVNLDFAEPEAVSGRFMFRLFYTDESCQWIITDIANRSSE